MPKAKHAVVTIPEGLHRQVKAEAARSGWPVQKLVRKALESYLGGRFPYEPPTPEEDAANQELLEETPTAAATMEPWLEEWPALEFEQEPSTPEPDAIIDNIPPPEPDTSTVLALISGNVPRIVPVKPVVLWEPDSEE